MEDIRQDDRGGEERLSLSETYKLDRLIILYFQTATNDYFPH